MNLLTVVLKIVYQLLKQFLHLPSFGLCERKNPNDSGYHGFRIGGGNEVDYIRLKPVDWGSRIQGSKGSSERVLIAFP